MSRAKNNRVLPTHRTVSDECVSALGSQTQCSNCGQNARTHPSVIKCRSSVN